MGGALSNCNLAADGRNEKLTEANVENNNNKHDKSANLHFRILRTKFSGLFNWANKRGSCTRRESKWSRAFVVTTKASTSIILHHFGDVCQEGAKSRHCCLTRALFIHVPWLFFFFFALVV